MTRSAAQLLEQARSATGLSDFGDDGFREGLDRLIHSATHEARLNAQGVSLLEMQVVEFLSQRLKVQEWFRRRPEIDEIELPAPLIVLGLPRTGSTALHCLLAEDPDTRTIRNWEGLQPCPKENFAGEGTDPRIIEAEALLAMYHGLATRLKQMVPATALSPVECQMYMAYDFKSQYFQASFYIPSYWRWLNNEAELTSTFRYLKRIMKFLQWQEPGERWVLKNPSHIVFIDALDKVFPDAKFCMTHRDVGNVMPSLADLYYELHKAGSDDIDKHAVSNGTIEWCELGMRRMLAFRDAGNDARFFDVAFEAVQRDPFPIIGALYGFIGGKLTEETRAQMQAWRVNTPRDLHGEHQYEAADFGIDLGALRRRFDFYTRRFNTPTGGKK